jgi:hypothetical protein
MIRTEFIAIALSVTLISCNGQTMKRNEESVKNTTSPQRS